MCCIHGSNSKYNRSHVLRPQCRRVEISVFGAFYARICFSCLFGFLTQARAPGHASGPAPTGGPQRKRRPAGASGPPWLGAGLSAWAEARLLWRAPGGVGLRQFPTAGSGTLFFVGASAHKFEFWFSLLGSCFLCLFSGCSRTSTNSMI